jgi:hypothetical protein
VWNCSREVHEEIKKKDDDVAEWCKDKQKEFFIEIDDACQDEVARLMALYPRLVDTVKGRSGADPFVIALASISAPRMIVVTEELPGKTRQPRIAAFCSTLSVGRSAMISSSWQDVFTRRLATVVRISTSSSGVIARILLL